MDGQEELSLEQIYQSVDGKSRFQKFPEGTPDPTKYHSLDKVAFLGGNSPIANHVGASSRFPGWRGLILPKASAEGGSMGYDPHKPQKMYIDPELTGGKIMVDFSKISKAQIDSAYREASDKIKDSKEDRACQAYLIMARMSEGARPAPAPTLQRVDPDLVLSSRPASFSARPVGEVQLPPAIDPPEVKTAAPSPGISPAMPSGRESIIEAARGVQRKPIVESQDMNTVQGQPAPQRRPLMKVVFELPEPIGYFQAWYSDVVRTKDLLILVANYKEHAFQQVWFPNPPKPGSEPTLLGVLVHDRDGNEDTAFTAYSTAGRFTYGDCEFAILAIENEKSFKELENERPS